MKVSAGVASLMRAFDQPPAPAPAPRAAAVPKRVVIDTRKELTELLARVAASDPSLVTLDLSGNRQFSSLAPAIKNQVKNVNVVTLKTAPRARPTLSPTLSARRPAGEADQ